MTVCVYNFSQKLFQINSNQPKLWCIWCISSCNSAVEGAPRVSLQIRERDGLITWIDRALSDTSSFDVVAIYMKEKSISCLWVGTELARLLWWKMWPSGGCGVWIIGVDGWIQYVSASTRRATRFVTIGDDAPPVRLAAHAVGYVRLSELKFLEKTYRSIKPWCKERSSERSMTTVSQLLFQYMYLGWLGIYFSTCYRLK